MRALACLAFLVACSGKPATDDADLASYLARVTRMSAPARATEIASWRLSRDEFEKLVVAPYRSLWFQYATHFDELAPSLAARLDHGGTFTARKHVAGDAALTPSQGRLRWTVPVQYPSMVVEEGGAPVDTVFVRIGSHWRSLSGIDEELLARARELDRTCGDRLATAGPPTKCTEIAWVVADAALRGQTDRFAHACQLASSACILPGVGELDAALRDAGLVRDKPSADNRTAKSASCTTPEYVVTGLYGEQITIRDHACHICTFALDDDPSPVVAGFARALRETPGAFLDAAALKRVSLCSSIVPDQATALYADTMIGGTIDPQRGGLMLLAEDASLTGEEILHHELFHLFDRNVQMLRYAPDDPAWEALNPKRFRYGRGQTAGPGFLSSHATASNREDRATVYQFMMAHPTELCERAAHDPILLGKARLLRDRIRGVIGASDYIDHRLPCL